MAGARQHAVRVLCGAGVQAGLRKGPRRRQRGTPPSPLLISYQSDYNNSDPLGKDVLHSMNFMSHIKALVY